MVGRPFHPQADVGAAVAQYRARVASDEIRRIVPVFAVAVAIVAAVTDQSTAGELLLMAIPPAALTAWTFVPALPLAAVTIMVVVPVVAVQHNGAHQPIMFEVSVLGSSSRAGRVAGGGGGARAGRGGGTDRGRRDRDGR